MEPLARAVAAESGVRAVLFDWDGTFADSTSANHAAMAEVVAPFGVELDRDWFAERSGVSSVPMLRTLLGDEVPDDELHRLARDRDEAFTQHEPEVAPFPDAVEVLGWCRDHGVAAAVASGGSRPVIGRLLDRWGIAFDEVVAAVDVTRGKPDPEAFLVAAARLGVDPSACLVLEDSDQGVEAAGRAGMRVLDVRTRRPAPTA